MSTFVLVHGSWHDGSAWQPVINHLKAKGHQAFAPTIAGHGKGVNKKGKQTEIDTLNQEIAHVADSMQPPSDLPETELLGKMIVAKSLQQKSEKE